MNDLDRCPFCGGRAIFTRDPEDCAEITGIYCLGCKAIVKWNIQVRAADTYGETQQKWTDKWNKRERADNERPLVFREQSGYSGNG